jgi:type II secretory pathway predicted ATPase ExeA
MFTGYFGLKFNPFTKEIPKEHLFSGHDLREFYSRMDYLQKARGIGLVVGEPGCGKSTALRGYACNLNPALFKYCYFSLANVTVLEFYQALAIELGVEPKHKKVALFHQIQQAISTLYYEQRITPVIILDEIHLASNKLLEDLRLIFNFSMDSQNPFVLILAGQPLIRSKLSLSINNPLRQRIVVKYIMTGLSKDEVTDYLSSRIRVAGSKEDVFTPPAVDAIYGISSGVPRVINSLATNSLLYACGKKQHQVDEEVVYQAQSEMNL